MGYKEHKPAVYVVGWPDSDVIKAGFSCNQRWRKFVLRGAHLLSVTYFDTSTEAFAFELVLETALRSAGGWAFSEKSDEAKRLLGQDCGGYLECSRLPSSEWVATLAEHCSLAMPTSNARQHCHGRTYGTDVLRTASPTRDNSPFVTRGRAYGEGVIR